MTIVKEEFEETKEMLATARRYNEPLRELVRSVGSRRMPVRLENGRIELKEEECLVFDLGGGFTGLCPAREFSEHKYNSLVGFVGTIQEFMVKEIATEVIDEEDKERNYAILSVKDVDLMRQEEFWKTIESLDEKGQLQDRVFKGTVAGSNPRGQTIFVKVEGTTCFMKRNDWDYGFVPNVQKVAVKNTPVEVKVLRFDRETKQVHVSRKAAKEDPIYILNELKEDSAVVGRVKDVDPIHGIFITLDQGVDIKGSKPKYLPEPIVGDIVTVRIQKDKVDVEARVGRGVIINYPQGKKKVRDIGAFLYGE